MSSISSAVHNTDLPTSTAGGNSDDDADALEPVYLVSRPLKLSTAPQPYLKRVGRIIEAVRAEKHLRLQHWGLLIGEHYYHLHKNDETQKISLSMEPFVDVDKHERHTIKVPIWRTHLTHDERVGIAVGVIKVMGNFKSEADVEILDKEGNIVTYRERYRMEGRYIPSLLAKCSLFRGKYNALSNNCVDFTINYLCQIIGRSKVQGNIHWVAGKWSKMVRKRGFVELVKFLWELLDFVDLFEFYLFLFWPGAGPMLVSIKLIKLLSIFLNINHISILDRKLASLQMKHLRDPTTGISAMPSRPKGIARSFRFLKSCRARTKLN
ncbi:hypothetical protein MSAN_01059100 [Mycena sanguinolenta]|uniref:Uncharacterized protein n=1 Tax=Mycena sanguinolenta TaxID=230812 RepID=A0A8H6YRU0_9AGAR|nr:hypothetical protein MSAN_01059100 [Mycena sanguinolenta]